MVKNFTVKDLSPEEFHSVLWALFSQIKQLNKKITEINSELKKIKKQEIKQK